MADSDGAWGQLETDELSEAFDSFNPIPERGSNAALDSFLERKHLTPESLVRVGARLVDDSALAYGFPGGIRYRSLIDDRRWTSPGAEWGTLKIVPGGRGRSDTVLVAEGESDAARLTILYPGVDVAVLPGSASMAARYVDGYVDQLSVYSLVLLATDPDRAGDEAYAILSERLPRVARWAWHPEKDWCELPPDCQPPPLPAPEDVAGLVTVGTLTFIDLAALLDDDLRPPELMVDELLYVEGIHFFNGHPGQGKTTLAMHAAYSAMTAGRHVVWLDYEGGDRATARRLHEMGVPHELMLERFHLAVFQPDPASSFDAVAEQWPGALIVLDSASKALSYAGLDENSPSDATKWLTPIVKATKLHALPIVIIDHVAKSATASSRYSRGAGSKLADTDVAWYIEAHTEFNRDQAGVIRCHRQKDREGSLPFELWYTVGDGNGGLPVAPTDPPTDPTAPTEGSDTPEL